jgi:hypothetical protein
MQQTYASGRAVDHTHTLRRVCGRVSLSCRTCLSVCVYTRYLCVSDSGCTRFTAAYWVIMTATTIGTPDLYPVTTLGRSAAT